MKKIWVLQHVECETLGTIEEVLKEQQVEFTYIRSFAGESVPKNLDLVDGLIVMGGPMGVNEEAPYPFLREEKKIIEEALKKEKPLLGICLGSQLLASVLGMPVTRGEQKEIGWYEVNLSKEAATDRLFQEISSSFTALHWHGDQYDLPRGAIPIAASELTSCQGFVYGNNAYGFLFHMEVTKKIIQDLVKTFQSELDEEKRSGEEMVRKSEIYLNPLQLIGKQVFSRWTHLLEERIVK